MVKLFIKNLNSMWNWYPDGGQLFQHGGPLHRHPRVEGLNDVQDVQEVSK